MSRIYLIATIVFLGCSEMSQNSVEESSSSAHATSYEQSFSSSFPQSVSSIGGASSISTYTSLSSSSISSSLTYIVSSSSLKITSSGSLSSSRLLFSSSSISVGVSSSIISSSSSVISSSATCVMGTQMVVYGNNQITDCRDGQTYATISMGAQIWMKQNLNYSRYNTIGWCYGVGGTDTTQHQNDGNCNSSYGRLYHWADAMDIISPYYLTFTATNMTTNRTSGAIISSTVSNQGLCPIGWHVPNSSEWEALAAYIRSKTLEASGSEGKYIKAVLSGNENWNNSSYNAQDPYGFSALPTGYRAGSNWLLRDWATMFWSSTESDASSASIYNLISSQTYFLATNSFKYNGYSLRCIKD